MIPQSHLPIDLTSSDPETQLLLAGVTVVGATLEQTIHEAYELRLQVTAPAARSQELLRLREKPLCAELGSEAFVPRVQGTVHRVRMLVSDLDGPVHHELFVRPAVRSMSNTKRKRIFHARTLQQIVEEVCSGHRAASIPSFHGLTSAEPREYTVQYEESDWDFVRRLLADEGVVLLAEPHSGRLLATQDSRLETLAPATMPFAPHSGQTVSGPFVERLTLDAHVVPKRVVVRAFDAANPLVELEGAAGQAVNGTAPPDEIYAFEPDAFRSHEAAQAKASQLLEEIEAEEEHIVLLTTSAVVPGTHLTVTGSPVELPKLLVTRSTTTYQAVSGGSNAAIRSTIVAIPMKRYRPTRLSKPLIRGAQTAFVRGAPGQSIDVDEAGRVEVEFRWDRRDARRAGALRRVRVGQAWAGAAYGLSAVPRVGDEVIVSFLNGDPDHPLIVGNVQNGAAPGPLSYPQEKAHTVLRTQSTPGSSGYNELRFIDDVGAERVQLRAERDLDMTALNDSTRFVGGNDSKRVEKDRSMVVFGNDTSVTGNKCSEFEKEKLICARDVRIECTTFTLAATGTRQDDCGKWTSKAGYHGFESGIFCISSAMAHVLGKGTVTIADGGGASIVLAGGSITLRAGASTITISDGLIKAVASLIELNP